MPAATGRPGWLADLGGGLHAIDTGFHRDVFDAAYLRVSAGRAAFIDTGTNFALPRLLAALDELGLSRESVDYVIPTHVHLDHAGGVGALMRELPRATVLAHPRAVRHLVDPSALYQGALAVYGAQEMARSYGELIPVPADRVQASSDGQVLALGDVRLRVADTPGHAKHHHCIWDEATRGWFTGDTFGLSYRELDTERGSWILPTSTPVQFEPEALRHSVQRLMAAEPVCMYLTHFGRVTDVPRLAQLQLGLLERTVALSLEERAAPDRHERLRQRLLALYLESLRAHGCTLAEAEVTRLLAIDLELNAQGLAVWLDRDGRPRPSQG